MHNGDFKIDPPIEVPRNDVVHRDVIRPTCDGDVQLDDAVDNQRSLVRRWHPTFQGNSLNDQIDLLYG